MTQPRKSFGDIMSIVGKIKFRDEWFVVREKGDGFLLQLRYMEPDVDQPDGGDYEQHARKWYISAYATESEIVRTAFAACMMSAEHRVREHFLYKGKRIFGPHIDVNRLGAYIEADEKLFGDHRVDP